ncbi:MAG: cytochrome P450 [Mycobacterium sp.]
MTATQTVHAAGPLPHPRFRLPILGDLLSVDLARPVQGLIKEARRHDGIFEQLLGSFPFVMISGPALIEDVNNEQFWEKCVGPSMRKMRSVAGDGLFTADSGEANWRKAHDILTPAFTKEAMTNYHASITKTVGEFINAWNTHADNRTWVDIPADTNRLTIEIISRAGFGHSFSSLTDPIDSPFIATMLRELDYANRRTDTIPFYEQLFGGPRKAQHYADKKFARAEAADIVAARRANPRTGAAPDMLDIMLTAPDPVTGEKLSDDNIINQILTFLVAGSETSANAIAFALHYLSIRPDIADKARAEVDQQWPDRQFPDVKFEDVAKLRYLRRVIDETLRLWPVAPGYFRQAKQDTTIGNGQYSFKKNQWVFTLVAAAQRDPSSWGPDADQFNPDRFISENLRKLPPRIYKPFGTGARACIGRQFAQHEMLLTLAAVLHQFMLEPRRGYQLKVSETLTLKPEDLQLRLHKRS